MEVSFNCLILFLIHLPLYLNQKTFIIEFKNTEISYTTRYTLGNSNLSTEIYLNSEHIVVGTWSYLGSRSNTSKLIEDKSYQTYLGVFSIYEYQDYISFPNNDNKFIIQFEIQDDDSIFARCNSGFGLGKNDSIIKEKSIINQLKENNLIEHLSYTISPYERKEDYYYIGKIYFGETPDEVIRNKKYKSRYHVTYNNEVGWFFNVSYIKLRNNVHIKPPKIMLQTEETSIKLPLEDLDVFKEYYFTEDIILKYCPTKGDPLVTMDIECDCSVIYELPDLEMVIGNYSFLFKPKDLFKEQKGKCMFKIRGDFISHSHWIFGLNFINLFITNFDYENNIITFYSDVVTMKEINSFSVVITLFQISTVLMLICSILLFISIQYK